MTFTYKNCSVSISEQDDAFNALIQFGDAELDNTISASSEAAAQEHAKQFIDLFIGDLPPALFYTNDNH